MNRRTQTLIFIAFCVCLLALILIGGYFISEESLSVDFAAKNLPPSTGHLFGTDWLGRDMFLRTIKGLSTSLKIGAAAACFSAFLAAVLGILAGVLPKWADTVINWLIDLLMGIPHIVLLILISFALGRGMRGVLIGIIFTHWMSLARLIRSEVIQLKKEQYILVSKKMGKNSYYIMTKHILPHVLPQVLIGMVLLFPHAILHEASITFLGFGLSPEQPAVGIILSESMKYLTAGAWWLAFFPGILLAGAVVLIDALGNRLKALIDPFSAQE